MESFLRDLAPAEGRFETRFPPISEALWEKNTFRVKVCWSPLVVKSNRVEDFQAAARDIGIMRRLHHAGIVPKLLDEQLSTALRLVCMTDWHDTLHDRIRTADASTAAKLAWAIVRLHQAKFIHCNISPRTVLVTHDKRVLLSGFEWAREFPDAGTIGHRPTAYMDPLVVSGRCATFGFKSDWWSFLLVLVAISVGDEALVAESHAAASGQRILMANMDHIGPQAKLRSILDDPDASTDDILGFLREHFQNGVEGYTRYEL
jgi:serine/threonine protein kinase